MSPSRISPGEVLADRYRLVDLLADVDGARFWRGTDSVLSRDVAVHAVSSDDERAAGMLKAARVSATVTDPHLLRVLDCAEDPVGALHAAYAGDPPTPRAACASGKALDANETFAKANGFAGTPVIVRASDGAVLHGYRDAATLRAFANARPETAR